MTNLSKVRQYGIAWWDLDGLPGFFQSPSPYVEHPIKGHFHASYDVLYFVQRAKPRRSVPICSRSYWESTSGPAWNMLKYTVDADVLALLGVG